MCGFAGAVIWDERYRVTPQTLQKMSAAIAHRGPDGEGFHHTRQGLPIDPANPQVALAFRRLAILDPDPRSNQPFTVGSKTLVFNGEIYNFRDLRRELTSLLPDWHWRTTGDTEALLAAYTAWGEGCVDHFNGMFALAVWDEAEKTLFLARDRMGQKPLYFAALDESGDPWSGVPATTADGVPFDQEPMSRRGNLRRRIEGRRPAAIAFASELPALFRLPWFDRSINDSAIRQYLQWGYLGGIETAMKGGQQLPPANWLRVRPAGFAASAYFAADRNEGFSSESFDASIPSLDRLMHDAQHQTRERLTKAVHRQLVSDVPLGCFLSGGVDSSVIASLMRSVTPQTHTFTVGFDDSRYDERQYARAVARHLGTQHHEFQVTANAAADLPKLAETFGEPFGDSSALPTYYLARETRRFVKVALSGDGGDELFGGYDRYRALRLSRQLWPVLEAASLLGLRKAAQRFDSPGSKGSLRRAGRLLASFDRRASVNYARLMRLFANPLLQALHQVPRLPNLPSDVDSLQMRFERLQKRERRSVVPAALAVDRMTYLPGDLLTKVDRASMLHNLEVRSPFMDHELVTFAAGLTTDQLLGGGPKRMLREAFAADLPAWVFKRKKMGFAVPIGEWFRGPLRGMLRDTLFSSHAFGRTHFNMKVVERLVEEHQSQRVDHSQRLYVLLMLELWWNTVRA